MYLSSGYTAKRPAEVRYLPSAKNSDMQVQVFLGDAHHTLYMSVDEARDLATQILAALPADDREVVEA